MPQRINPETGRGFRFKDRTGTRHGRLVFTRPAGLNAHGHQIWEAVCDCGNTTRLSSATKTRSCGCLQREAAARTQRNKALPPEVKAESRRVSSAKVRARRRTDPVLVMQARLSRLHRHALARVGAIKSSPTFEQLGYTAEAFAGHIERQFLPGMGWHNMERWQIDHIVPASEARDVKDVVALNQLSNLRPMWAKENNEKRSRRQSLL